MLLLPTGEKMAPKYQMSGQALGLSLTSPPHPAAATFPPLGEKDTSGTRSPHMKELGHISKGSLIYPACWK
ncbi:hypothetical protein DXT97_06540 [Agrobacterium tumefaciens]|nr:hypothetical protein [Agrobacterium tumefaciens]